MDSKTIKEKFRRFREWQKTPYQVKPLSKEPHDCPTCGTCFEGNFCPRCGQSARIGYYSVKTAFLQFLDVWGLGNRGMFRTIRDLLLRPGYMIRDYLRGMQMAYFPPFKMFFLLVAISFAVQTGLNIRLENRYHQIHEKIGASFGKIFVDNANTVIEPENNPQQEQTGKKTYSPNDVANKIREWIPKHISIILISLLLLFSWPLFLMFRKGPACPGIRFSGFFVAMVYTYNMLAVYSIITNFFCMDSMVGTCCAALTVVPLKQLSGYSLWRTLLNIMMAILIFIVVIVVLSILISIGIGIAIYLFSLT